jgi:simple sugar transport system permease protein
MITSEKIIRFLKPVLSVVLGLAAGLLVTRIAGEDPLNVLQILIRSAFGSRYDLGMTLFYATPLIFTGLSVSFAFQAGLFNIGAEGQLALGALAAAAVGIYFPQVPSWIAPVFAGVAALLAGALWGAIPGWLRAKRGSHEVINTIMLNFIAAGLCSWLTLYVLRNPDSQNPESAPVAPSYLISHLSFFEDSSVNSSLFLALLVAWGVWFFLWKTTLGYEIRAVGQNESAAQSAGINSAKVRILAMAIAGGLAGLVGVGEVLGNAERFRLGFSPGYGFIGIAVALLGRNKPLGVVAAAILFGALHKGTSDLDLETENVTRDLSQILQALVILCVSADGLWSYFGEKIKDRFKKKGKPQAQTSVLL